MPCGDLTKDAERPEAAAGAPPIASPEVSLVGGPAQPLDAARPLDAPAEDRRLRSRDLAIVLFVAFGGAIGVALMAGPEERLTGGRR
jgi:hypothetical protein